jgi:hypothetical protein
VREHALVLELPPGPVSARRLIEAAVTAEVAAHAARAEEASLVRVLTDASLRDDLARGAVRAGGPQEEGFGTVTSVDVSSAVQTALLAFEDGIFKVFVGDDELTDDADAAIDDGAALLFLRLVPLAGG